MSHCQVIVSANIKHQASVDAYKSVAGPVMKKHGAQLPAQTYNVHAVIAGKAQPEFILKIGFPDKNQALAAFADPEYSRAIEQRDEGFGDLSIVLVEEQA